jgi:hypothetical protein
MRAHRVRGAQGLNETVEVLDRCRKPFGSSEVVIQATHQRNELPPPHSNPHASTGSEYQMSGNCCIAFGAHLRGRFGSKRDDSARLIRPPSLVSCYIRTGHHGLWVLRIALAQVDGERAAAPSERLSADPAPATGHQPFGSTGQTKPGKISIRTRRRQQGHWRFECQGACAGR